MRAETGLGPSVNQADVMDLEALAVVAAETETRRKADEERAANTQQRSTEESSEDEAPGWKADAAVAVKKVDMSSEESSKNGEPRVKVTPAKRAAASSSKEESDEQPLATEAWVEKKATSNEESNQGKECAAANEECRQDLDDSEEEHTVKRAKVKELALPRAAEKLEVPVLLKSYKGSCPGQCRLPI